ncbi:hypothetical protein CBR_g31784 [Chara braunii]|uniref:Reverse transcriptase domain-containing protein n=1 Tax=Chara braunii TaxID=69332 RepID=A0A388LFM8_CHABU|nr:hypothetical protein CBR_g31784 [Chara braunii]|eukprot:GBG81108.1 hypothetical protein CBR_g31784 [Chara braunii]
MRTGRCARGGAIDRQRRWHLSRFHESLRGAAWEAYTGQDDRCQRHQDGNCEAVTGEEEGNRCVGSISPASPASFFPQQGRDQTDASCCRWTGGAEGGDRVDESGRGKKRRGGTIIIHDDSSTTAEGGETTDADDPDDSDYVPRIRTADRDDGGGRRWVRCPMRICNAPATFQRVMNMTFQNFVNKTRLTQGMINFCVIVYMADILVYSETYHGHVQHIEWTLGALRDAGFKIALEKSEFFLSEISFLGYVVTRGGLRPDSRKVAAVRGSPVPMSLTQVRAFLGLASYYRRFIKGFAAIVRPLTNLLRKDQPLSWDAECQQAFATLKDILATTPILIRPDPSKQFILVTDWQPEAISAILAQKGNDGREHVIEYASRTVPDKRRNHSAPQGGCYAGVWGIQHFHPYLYGQKFRLVTDHEPLLTLNKLTNYTGMIGRWAVRLQEYDFDIVHRKTERHDNVDGLTRLHRHAKVPKGEEITPWKESDLTNEPKYGQVAVLPRGKKQNSGDG